MEQSKIVSYVIALALIGSSGAVSAADAVGSYHFTIVGPSVSEPVGDRPNHALQTLHYSCVGTDELFEGAIMTGNTAIEWRGTEANLLAAITTHRMPGGFAVFQLLEGKGSLVDEKGRPHGSQGQGKASIRFASGGFALLPGKTLRWTSKPVDYQRFEQTYFAE